MMRKREATSIGVSRYAFLHQRIGEERGPLLDGPVRRDDGGRRCCRAARRSVSMSCADVAGHAGAVAEGLGDVAFAEAGLADQQYVLPLLYEGAGAPLLAEMTRCLPAPRPRSAPPDDVTRRALRAASEHVYRPAAHASAAEHGKPANMSSRWRPLASAQMREQSL